VTTGLLAIDAGNSQIELGLAGESGWRQRWRLATKPSRTVDEYGVTVSELLELEGADPTEVRQVVLSCVVPSLTPVLAGMSQEVFGVAPLVVNHATDIGVEVLYDPPGSVGPDRLVDALAARERFGAPAVVVDFGTATTFNVVDRSGAFVGGAIAPGLGVAASALARSGARLRRIDLAPANGMSAIGRDTARSMRSGVLYGYAGLVEGLLSRIDVELGQDAGAPAKVVATGGMCRLVAPMVDRFDAVVPGLTLDGLRLVSEMNLT
jgi:type III pantothenate kinase